LSKNKGFSDTSAARYSLALFELAQETNCIEEVEEHSNSIIKLINSNEEFNSLIKNPTNKKEDQLNVINGLSEHFKLNSLLTKFINFLILKRRFFYVKKF